MNLKELKRRLVRTYAKRRIEASLETEHVPCPICGESSDFDTLHDKDRYGISVKTVRCAKCGLVFENPMPTEGFLDSFYGSHLFRALDWGVFKPNEKMLAEFGASARAEKHINLIKNMMRKGIIPMPKALLDVGASDGTFIERLGGSFPGIAIAAVEPGANFSSRIMGDVALYDSIRDVPEESKFDVVSLWHVLEHVRDARGFLAEVTKRLAPGGAVLIEVPDVERYDGSLRPIHIDHVLHFSEATLVRFASDVGLVPVYISRDSTELMDELYGMALAFRLR